MRDVYRIESAVHKIGPYQCGLRSAIDKQNTTRANHVYELMSRAPTAWDYNGKWSHVRELHDRTKHQFGFASIEQANEYFDEELRVVLEEFGEHKEFEMLFVKFNVPEDAVIEGNTQVIFERDKATQECAWPVLQIANELEARLNDERTHTRPDTDNSISLPDTFNIDR